MPTLRQYALICALWAVTAWLTTALFGFVALDHGLAKSFVAYYAVRAPVAGAIAAAVGAPMFVGGRLRVFRGLVGGQIVAAAATLVLLLIWPNDMQNTRMDALKWVRVFWGLYWYLFVPAGGLAGLASAWIAR